MLPALVRENLPRLTRVIKLLPGDTRPDAAVTLADELAGITVMVAEKFTNHRTVEGIQKAVNLTVGGVSLGLEELLAVDSDEAALDFLVDNGAEAAFQAGFRQLKDLAAMPEDTLVGEYDQDPVYAQRRLRDIFFDICLTDANANWTGPARYQEQFKQRQEAQAVVRFANWLRRHNTGGPVKDADLNAEGVIALAIIFAVEGAGRIVARTGQKDFERFVKAVRAKKPDFETGWAELVAAVPVQHHPVLLHRIDLYRQGCTVLQHIPGRTAMKTLFAELENYAGSELDPDYD
ncbi:hypothetical protein GJV26_07165 [Massilia dura]|uniref:Uncharacterized protein n=1 Tax=Pseudoduganella dura TaxID=321982 RepID=A0A6I3X7J4_9BURK|nr:hypothetical protein [Pseudoduganella dura]MUI12257.1 hypothetical protein [Pseudoduganella dura]GGY07461.1 hypothetical protein GCM10007386_42570 [Pseudoduganella dura]